MAKPKIKIPAEKFNTNQGKWLLHSITARFIEFQQKYKAKPLTLYLGKNQAEVLDLDPKAKEVVMEGHVEFTDNQSEVRFK